MPTQMVFLVLPQVHLLDLAGPDQIFHESCGQGAALTLRYCSYTSDVRTSAGLPFGALAHFSEVALAPGDILFIPGAELSFLRSPELRRQRALFAWIAAAHRGGATLAAVCSGAFVLAQAGLLDGRRCTTHWKRVAELQRDYPAVRAQENVLFTEDDRVFTSAGITAGIDLALHLIEQMKGPRFAHQVAREMVLYTRRAGDQPQQSVYLEHRNHIHAGVHRVQDWLIEHLSQRPRLADLARLAGMSERSLSRLFRRETGLSVHEYLTALRRARAAELLRSPDLSRDQVAAACGLAGERHLRRLLAVGGAA